MTRWLSDFRLLPLVLLAIGSLFALKTFGLFSGGGYSLGQRMDSANTLVVTTVHTPPVQQLVSPALPMEIPAARPQKSWMHEVFRYPGGDITGSVPADKLDITGSSHGAKPKEPEKPAAPVETAPPAGTVVNQEPPKSTSPGERALLERLQERRQELDARARELDLRESMLKAAEKKLEIQNAVEKAEEAGGGGSGGGGAKTGPVAQRKEKEEVENSRFKGVVTMYETMKPKEAAKIFDRLDIGVLIDVASQIKPQIMAAILAQMSPEVAERLTVELAAKTGSDRSVNPSKLPKIDGRPGGT
jgi:flagellar motility protein MotE (MotC chaperone)